MKRNKHKRVKLLTQQDMLKLTTKNLLAYLRRLHKVHDNPNWEDGGVEITKQNSIWKETYKNCKEILATREHL